METETKPREARQARRRYRELEQEFKKSDLKADIVHSQSIQIMMTESVAKGEIPSDYPVKKFIQEVEEFLAQEADEAFTTSQPPGGSFAQKKQDEAQVIREALGNVFGLTAEEIKSILPYLCLEEGPGTRIFDKDGPKKFGIVLNFEDKYDGLAGVLRIFSQGQFEDPVSRSNNIHKAITMEYEKFKDVADPSITAKILYSMIADDLFHRLFRWSGHVKLDRPAVFDIRQKNVEACDYAEQHWAPHKILREHFPPFRDPEKFTDWDLELLRRYMVMHGKGENAKFLTQGATASERSSSIFLVFLGQIDVKLGEDRTYAIKRGDVVGEYSFLTKYPRSYDVLHGGGNFLTGELHSGFLNAPAVAGNSFDVNKAYQLISKIFEIIIESVIKKIISNNEYMRKKEKMDKLKKMKM